MTDEQAADLTVRYLEAVVADHVVPMPSLVTDEAAVLRVRAATQAMDWTIAEMPAHQIDLVARYLRWLLQQDPIKASPIYEPQRIVLGLLMLALRDVHTQLEALP